jgi:hypothetical protein
MEEYSNFLANNVPPSHHLTNPFPIPEGLQMVDSTSTGSNPLQYEFIGQSPHFIGQPAHFMPPPPRPNDDAGIRPANSSLIVDQGPNNLENDEAEISCKTTTRRGFSTCTFGLQVAPDI